MQLLEHNALQHTTVGFLCTKKKGVGEVGGGGGYYYTPASLPSLPPIFLHCPPSKHQTEVCAVSPCSLFLYSHLFPSSISSLSCPNAALTKPLTKDDAKFCRAESRLLGPMEAPTKCFKRRNVRDANFHFHGMVQAAVLTIIHILDRFLKQGRMRKGFHQSDQYWNCFKGNTAETFNSWQTHDKSSDTGRKLSTMRVQQKKGRIYPRNIIQTDTFSGMFTWQLKSVFSLQKHKRALPLESKGFTNTQTLSFSIHHFYITHFSSVNRIHHWRSLLRLYRMPTIIRSICLLTIKPYPT